jgi:hypothetical protein
MYRYELGREIELEDEQPLPITIDHGTGQLETEDAESARIQSLEDNWEELQEICAMVADRERRRLKPVSCENCGSYNFDPHVATRTLTCSGPHCHKVYTFERYREEVCR